MGSREDTTVVVTKHVTHTFKVTSAASICIQDEVFVINKWVTHTVHVEYITIECVYIHAYMNLHALGVQKVLPMLASFYELS